ncbi:MAG TPA: hypothetical protein VN151_14595, partial [Terracidiphilus sp.]|nr:hypothetical protein [Terracidiphilus sp.]
MTKQPQPKQAKPQKAPRAAKPAAPSASLPQSATQPAPDQGARINRRAADRLRAGHLWVYASDIEQLVADKDAPPALLPVADSRGMLLGTALFSPASQIALRMVAREALDEAAWLA